MPKAYLYARFSPRRGESQSNEMQLHYCRQHAKDKGYSIGGEYSDEYASGDDQDRAGLWAAMAELTRGDVLIVWRLDRLARDVLLCEVIHREARKAGATIEAVEGTTENTPEGVLMRQILQAMAEYEKKVIAMRTKYAMTRLQASGRRMTRPDRLPYGWRLRAEDQQMEPDPEERAVIEIIRELHAAGHSLRAISMILADRGIMARCGGVWRASSLARVVHRECTAA